MSSRWAAVGAAAIVVVGAGWVPARAEAPPGGDGAGSGERADAAGARARVSAEVGDVRFTSSEKLASGATFRRFETSGAGGRVAGDLVGVDLRRAGVGLLRPPVVAARRTVSAMADAQHAVAGVNGDFFNISETHSGVPPTGSSSGPEVDGGRPLKGAVPDGQRFGPRCRPARPPRTSSESAPTGEGIWRACA